MNFNGLIEQSKIDINHIKEVRTPDIYDKDFSDMVIDKMVKDLDKLFLPKHIHRYYLLTRDNEVSITATIANSVGVLKKTITFKARCSKEDTFDLLTGFEIAYKRLQRYCKRTISKWGVKKKVRRGFQKNEVDNKGEMYCRD